MWIAIQNAVGARQGVGGGPGPTPPYTPPMDEYPADVAYSVRLVSTSYTGPCIEAYRVSDGATQDIGFDSNGRISATELAAFSGGSVLEVQTWYDQMPGANHAISTINDTTGTLTRAIIYSGSSIITDGIEPALDFVNPADYPTLRFSNLGAASGYESFQVSTAATTNSGTPLYVTGIPYNFNYHQPISYPNGNVYEGFGSNTRPALLGIGFPNMYMQHVYNTTAGPTKNVLINNTLIATASSAANIGSLSHYISAMAKTQVGDDPKGRYIGYIKELFIYKSIQTSGVRDVLTSNINNFYQIGNFPDYTSGFLADYPDAAAAYSVRKLSNTAIKALRVRRTVAPFDEQDIGFTAGGDLDEAAISTFGASDTLVVSRWYDQSGFSRHAVQDASNAQPQIYNGTAVITENGKPALQFNQDKLGEVDIVLNQAFSSTSVARLTATPTFSPLFGSRDSGGIYGSLVAWSGSGSWTMQSSSLASTGDAYDSNQHLFFNVWNGASSIFAKDGGSAVTLNPGTTDWQNLSIGTRGTDPGSSASNGLYQELIFWDTDKNAAGQRTAIETNISDYYTVSPNGDAPTSGFLFDYSGATFAYSIRQLNDNADYCMQVIRADGVTLSIGFDGSGYVDTAAIVSFAAGQKVYLNRMYDQTGNRYHSGTVSNLIGTTTLVVVYDGTNLITKNGQLMPQMDLLSQASNSNIASPTGTALGVTHSLYAVVQRPNAPSALNMFSTGNGGVTALYQERSGNLTYGPGWTSFGIYTYPTVSNEPRLYSYIRKNGTDGECFNDGVSQGTTTAMTAATSVNISGYAFNKANTGIQANCSGFQEMIAYTADRTAVGDNANILANIKAYYPSIP